MLMNIMIHQANSPTKDNTLQLDVRGLGRG